MMEQKLAVIILAAGLGKRTGSDNPKALLNTSEKPLIAHVLETSQALEPERIVVVTGHKRELVEKAVQEGASSYNYRTENLCFAFQPQQIGTGNAVRHGLAAIPGFAGDILILYADVPLLRLETLTNLIEKHRAAGATLSMVSLRTETPNAYGRVVRDSAGLIQAVVEARDAGPQHAGIREYNIGIYLAAAGFLTRAVNSLSNENAQREYYLTDIVEKAVAENLRVNGMEINDEKEVQGVNDLYDLHLINREIQQRRCKNLILSGVNILEPDSFFCGPQVTIGRGVTVGPAVQLYGKTTIEEGVVLEGCAVLRDTVVKKGARIKLGVSAEQALVGENAQVGPFAHLREGSQLGPESRVGNFVETKKAVLGPGVKASHLTYLGDCTIGEETNIGAGTITCNYDGYHKNKTTIGKNAFIGSDTSLVAPVTVGDGAVVGAGSTITKDVEPDSLALTRAPQISKPGWAKQRRAVCRKDKHSD